jgi:hypothetical protein
MVELVQYFKAKELLLQDGQHVLQTMSSPPQGDVSRQYAPSAASPASKFLEKLAFAWPKLA